MGRREMAPETRRLHAAIGERLRLIRLDRHGERGSAAMARELGVPGTSWCHWETGRAMPAEVLLRVLERTDVEPAWLLHGVGPRYRLPRTNPSTSATEALSRRIEATLTEALAAWVTLRQALLGPHAGSPDGPVAMADRSDEAA